MPQIEQPSGTAWCSRTVIRYPKLSDSPVMGSLCSPAAMLALRAA